MDEARLRTISEAIKKGREEACRIRAEQQGMNERLKLLDGFLKDGKSKLTCNLFFYAVNNLDLGKPVKLDLTLKLNRVFSTLKKSRGVYAPEFEREIALSERMKQAIIAGLAEMEQEKMGALPGTRGNTKWVSLWEKVSKKADPEDLKKFEKEAERLLAFFAAERERLTAELERSRGLEGEANKRTMALELEKEAVLFEEKMERLKKEAGEIRKGSWEEICNNLRERTPARRLKEAEKAVGRLKAEREKERRGERCEEKDAEKPATALKELKERLEGDIKALERKADVVSAFSRKLGANNGFDDDLKDLKKNFDASFNTEEFRERMAKMQEETEVLYLQINALNKIGKKHQEIELGKLRPLITEIVKKRNYNGMERLVRLLRWVIKYERGIGHELQAVTDLISRREYEKAKAIVNRHKTEKEARNESEIEKSKNILGFGLVSDEGILVRMANLRRSIGGGGIDALRKKGKVEYRANHSHTLSGARISLQRLGFNTRALMKADAVSVYFEKGERRRLDDLLALERKIQNRNAELPDKEA